LEEDDDVLIPPVPSKYSSKKLEVEAEAEQELPVFEEHEISQDIDTSTQINLEEIPEPGAESATETNIKSKETTIEYEQLPFDVVHRFIRGVCFFSLLIWIALIVILSIVSKSTLTNTLVGLSPVLLTIIVTYILVDKYHLESGFLLIFPFIFTGILYMLGTANLLQGINYKVLSSINILFGLFFEAVVTVYYSFLARKRRVKKKEVVEEEIKEEKQEEIQEVPEETGEEPKPQVLEEPKVERKLIVNLDDEESIKKFVSSIEDKAKALNAVIGRVYSVKHGGTEELRAKIKIDSEHYNEISQLHTEEPDKRKETATLLLKKIRERLGLLQRPEKEVFERSEVRNLEDLDRDKSGKEDIIDVLMKNDKDPVAIYYQGALDFCDEALKELEAGNEIVTQ
jgi:hypothetical protein